VIEVVGEKAETLGYTVDSVANLAKSPVERQVGLGAVVVRIRSEQFKAKNR